MTAEQKKKSKEFLNKLHAKYYGEKKSKAQEPKTLVKKLKESKVGDAFSKGPSRNELMLKAKAKGIKNFRVINKEDLIEILKEGITKERINELVAQAVAKWKSSWGRGKRKQKAQK
jgi:hypothetical protein